MTIKSVKRVITPLFSILTFLYNSSYSQINEEYPKFHFGVFAGNNLSNISSGTLGETPIVYSHDFFPPRGKSLPSFYPFTSNYNWTNSFNFGAFAKYSFAKTIYFESGLTIISKSANSISQPIMDLAYDYYNGISSTTYHKNYEVVSDYGSNALQVPLKINFVPFYTKHFILNLYLGFFVETLLSHKTNISFSSAWNPINPPSEVIDFLNTFEKKQGITFNTSLSESSFKNSNVGYLAGIGFNFKKIGIDFGYNLSDRTYGSAQYRAQSLVANLRYQIK
jgi:Outer membrane protein beta-barrel domain